MPKRLLPIITLAVLCPAAASAASLEAMLPRGEQVCFGSAVRANPVFDLVRITRPERYQAYDSSESRVARLVINFANPKARLEDTGTCREKDGDIVCTSNSCEGSIFTLREERDGSLRIRFERDIPQAIWSCADAPLRNLKPGETQRSILVRRNTGTCIPANWKDAD